MTGNKERAMAALLTSKSVQQAAKKCGLHERTLKGYLDDKDFRAEYDYKCRGLIEEATRQAQKAVSSSLMTMEQIVNDTKVNAAVRAQTARGLIEICIKLTDQKDVLKRIEELENRIEERGNA